jgi:hypothetical protein
MSDYKLTLKVDMGGLDRKVIAIDRLSRAIRDTAWRASGFAVQSMTGVKSGRAYNISRGGTPIIHIASAPGEAPARLTGRLANSIKPKPGKDMWEYRVGTASEYAQILEVKRNRPFLIPAGQKAFEGLITVARSIVNGS